MNCERPYTTKGGAFGCGQCLPCRIQRPRIWTHRIILEAAQHKENAFVTLTYDDAHCPENGSVDPRHLSLFLKRLRGKSARKLRYYACGEYGGRTQRPHYHIALFNHPSCSHGITRTNPPKSGCCAECNIIADTWGMGIIQLGTLEQQSAQYIAGYVSKKRANTAPPGAHPEFTRMSLRPGIGTGLMHEVASALLQHNLNESLIDVPLTLRHGNREWPLGRFLRRKLRTFIGRPPNAPAEVLAIQEAELQNLRETAWNNQTSLKTEVLKKSLGRRIQIEARYRRNKRETV